MHRFARSLVWFRRDLRDFDHAALHAALRDSKAVYCAFAFDREILDRLPDRADRRVEFIHGCVTELDAALRGHGGALLVRHALARDAIPRLAAELDVEAVFANHDYEPAAIARDSAVARDLAAQGRTFLTCKDQVVFERDEILTQAGHKPSRDWLGLVKSSRSRNKIKHWLNVHQRERAIEIGRKLIEKEARKYRIALKEIKDEELQKVASGYGLGKADDLMSGIGYGKYSARQVLARLLPAGATHSIAGDIESEGLTSQPGGIASVVRRVFGDHNAITVRGQGDMMVYRARCCNPIRGESIVGYITRGKGVAVHSIHCPNVTNLMYEPERRIDVEWARDESTPTAYPVKLTVFCDDRFGMLKSITGVIGDAKSNIKNITAHTSNSQASVEVVLDIADLKHLEQIIVGLRKIPGVHEVQRLQKI